MVRKSDGRAGVSTRDPDRDGEIKIRFDDDGGSGLVFKTDVWIDPLFVRLSGALRRWRQLRFT